jgi:hypothetical protein
MYTVNYQTLINLSLHMSSLRLLSLFYIHIYIYIYISWAINWGINGYIYLSAAGNTCGLADEVGHTQRYYDTNLFFCLSYFS